MKLVDANLLLQPYDPSTDHHAAARVWLKTTDNDFGRFDQVQVVNPLD